MECNSKEDGVEKTTNTGENSSPKSEIRSAADKVDDEAPPVQFTGTEKSEEHTNDVEQNCMVLASETGMNGHVSTQVSCLPSTSTSKPQVDGESLDSLKARVTKLKRENCKLSHELLKRSAMSVEVQNANSLLMDELKKMCDPYVIQILEAMNPNNHPQTDGEMGRQKQSHE